jgi:hypothetical protein
METSPDACYSNRHNTAVSRLLLPPQVPVTPTLGQCGLVTAVLLLIDPITCSAVSTVALTIIARLDRGLCTGHRLPGPAAAVWLPATCRETLPDARIMLVGVRRSSYWLQQL